MDVLGRLFGSPSRVKILRLFLFNSDKAFDHLDVALRSQIPPSFARREIVSLRSIGLLKPKVFMRQIIRGKGKKAKALRKRVKGYTLDTSFKYRAALQELLVSIPLRLEDLTTRLSRAGTFRLLIAAGVLIRDWEGRVDLLLVGDKINKNSLKRIISSLEAEIGKELRYVLLTTAEFNYRLGVNDRLVRDVLDYPHQKVINRLNF